MATLSLKKTAFARSLRRIGLRIVIVFGLGIMLPATAMAAMAVVDASAITKLAEQYKVMKDQLKAALDQISALKELNAVTEKINDVTNEINNTTSEINEVTKDTNEVTKDISDTSNNTFDAIGKAGSITLPTFNLEKLAGNLKRDISCMVNRLDIDYPTLGFENLNFGSICAGRTAYKEALFVQPEEQESRTWTARLDELEKIEKRRRAITKEAAVSGLSMAKLNTTDISETNSGAVQDLQSSVNAATTQNERLAVIAQGIVLLAQLEAQSNQMQAKSLEIQSVLLMVKAVPLSSDYIDEGPKEGTE